MAKDHCRREPAPCDHRRRAKLVDRLGTRTPVPGTHFRAKLKKLKSMWTPQPSIGESVYDVHLLSETGGSIRSSIGISVATEPFDDTNFDTPFPYRSGVDLPTTLADWIRDRNAEPIIELVRRRLHRPRRRSIPGAGAKLGARRGVASVDRRCFDHAMARAARTAKPPLSKLLACFNLPVGLSKREGDLGYQAAPSYYDAAWEWYRSLSLDQQDMVSAIIAAWSMPDRRKAAERLAAKLPPAPKCPL
jgi:hypothetical protein